MFPGEGGGGLDHASSRCPTNPEMGRYAMVIDVCTIDVAGGVSLGWRTGSPGAETRSSQNKMQDEEKENIDINKTGPALMARWLG